MNSIIEENKEDNSVEKSKEKSSSLKKNSFSLQSISSRLHSIDLNDLPLNYTPIDINMKIDEEIQNLDDVIEESDDENADYPEVTLNCIIIDCTPITYIDSVGVHTLHQVFIHLSLFYLLKWLYYIV